MFDFFTVAYSQKLTFKLSRINICTKDGLSIFVSPIMVSGYSKLVKWKLLSHVRLFATLWTIQSMGFSKPEEAPTESERQMNKWTEILPLIIAFCFLAPAVHPPPAAQRWSSLITLLPGCSVFEQQEGKKERKWDGPGEGRKNHGELVNGIFVFWNEIWRKQGIR